MDNLLRQTGPQGFDKAIQAMQIAGAKDLVFDASHSWRVMDKRTRMAMIELQSMDREPKETAIQWCQGF